MTEENANQTETVALLDAQYPLLKEFRRACPGTYKHSQTLAAIIEAIAMDIGLDVEAMKIRAMYHDIGKMMNPEYFSENQKAGENAHDGLDLKTSYEIITRHVSDSVMILINDGNFPRGIIESISRHHGQTLLKSVANKSEGGDVEKFRYKTPKPETVEDVVLMITDTAEASARAMFQAGKLDDLDAHVDNIVKQLMDGGHLSEVTIKIGDLVQIQTTLKAELGGLFQNRVDYDADGRDADTE
jgi:hypothetical protein